MSELELARTCREMGYPILAMYWEERYKASSPPVCVVCLGHGAAPDADVRGGHDLCPLCRGGLYGMSREDKLVAAAKQAIPWLVLLGDLIGNGTPAQPNGRCEAILALSDALGADDDVPRGLPQ